MKGKRGPAGNCPSFPLDETRESETHHDFPDILNIGQISALCSHYFPGMASKRGGV